MKLRDPKTGEMFENVFQLLHKLCNGRDCSDSCPMDAPSRGYNCWTWAVGHPAEAARLMGYEVVEEEVVPPWEEKEVDFMPDTKPHICEVLGVEEFERICEAVHDGWWEEKKRQGVTNHPDKIPYGELAEDVKEYDRVTVRRVLDALGIHYESKPRFTEEEAVDAKVLARALLADGFERNRDGDLFATSSVVCWTRLDSRMFPSIRPGQSIRIQDIIASGTQR